MSPPVVEVVADATPDVVSAVARLLPQLSATAPVPGPAALAEIVASPATDLLVARVDGVIVGTLTLVVFRIPTGLRAAIEDVVVDDAVRGRGVGAALSRFALARAAVRGATTVGLTSHPHRVAANALYRKLGFVPRETNVYRYDV